MKLFRSIFGGGEAAGRYPESLIEAAIERAVDGTDSRLRLQPGYRKQLRAPIVHAIDHVCALVDALPAPIAASHGSYSEEPRLSALFASPAAMLETFSRAPDLIEFLGTPAGSSARRITAMVGAERIERNILGMDLVDDQVQKEVAQIAVSFGGHRVLEPESGIEDTRRQLRHRAFDHLLVLALRRIAEAEAERADLLRERDLLRRKQATLARGGSSFDAPSEPPADAATLPAELAAIGAQLDALGADAGLLKAHLDMVADTLNRAERELYLEHHTLHLDAMNIQRNPDTPSARRIEVDELYSATGRRLVLLLVDIDPAELPPRQDFLAAAARYQY
jgi:hypothetical protein